MTKNTQATTTKTVLRTLKEEYDRFMASGFKKYSLEQLINNDSIVLDSYCSAHKPNGNMTSLINDVRKYCLDHGIWLDNARHHISTVPFLFSSGDYQRMLPLMKNLTIDFYLNDLMGRDIFSWLPPEEQDDASNIIERIVAVDECLDIPPGATPIEVANIDVLKEMKRCSPPQWFSRFLRLFNYHVAVTHRDGNMLGQDGILPVDQYIILRSHIGGMNHLLLWVEYSDDRFLDWDLLANEGLADMLRTLHLMIAEFGALSNDLFSFEKEVIDLGSHCNLVAVLAFNHPDQTLPDVLAHAATIVRERIVEAVSNLQQLKSRCKELQTTAPEMSELLSHHLEGLDYCMQACWLWQKYAHRYKREHSIWIETVLKVYAD